MSSSSEPICLKTFIADFASGVELADSQAPQARSARGGKKFQPGIGPHSEEDTIQLVMAELARVFPDRYREHIRGADYPGDGRNKCDLCIGRPGCWQWAIECKMLRMLGDNGKPNDNMLMHILSPYDRHRSALTDCHKVIGFSGAERQAITIFGYESREFPLETAIVAFEALARTRVTLGQRVEKAFGGLIHTVHREGRVFGWEVDPIV